MSWQNGTLFEVLDIDMYYQGANAVVQMVRAHAFKQSGIVVHSNPDACPGEIHASL